MQTWVEGLVGPDELGGRKVPTSWVTLKRIYPLGNPPLGTCYSGESRPDHRSRYRQMHANIEKPRLLHRSTSEQRVRELGRSRLEKSDGYTSHAHSAS